MKHQEPTTLEEIVGSLAADVDYWKARAIKAEHDLRLAQERSIKAAGLWGPYASMLGLLGRTPTLDLEPVV